MKKCIDRRQFVLGGTSAIAAAAMLGMVGCSIGEAGGSSASGSSGNTNGPVNNGTVDISHACQGQDTPGLATLEESISYNQITLDESEKSTAPTINQDTVTYLHASDYGRPTDLKIELLTPSTAKAGETPLVVWVNGGGFTNSDAAGRLATRIAMAKAGYVVASVQHRTGSASNFPTPLQDIKAAIRFLKAHADAYKFNPSKVAVAGNSSGGYYATMVGVTGNVSTIPWPNRKGEIEDTPLDVGENLDQSSAVNAVVDFYGVSDLTIIGSGLPEELEKSHHSAATTEAILLNGAAAAKKGVDVFDESMEQKASAASPFSYINATTPPFAMFHGTADTLVSPVSTKMLQKRLEDAGVHAERLVIEGAGHGTPEFDQDVVVESMLTFLDSFAGIDIVAGDGSVDFAKGTASYKAEDLPTLDEAIEGAETVEVDPNKWIVNQVKDVTYKAISTKNTYSSLRMNMLLPSIGKEDAPRPVLYCAACGGFSSSGPSAIQYLRYAERGFAVAVAEIRVVPNTTMPGPIQDAKAGVRWLRAHAADYNIDPNCIIATGRSAGGYTGVMLGVLGNTTQYSDEVKFDAGDNLDQSSAVQGVLDFYGVSDLTIIGAGLPNYDVHDSESNTEALWVNGTAFGPNPGGSVFSDLDKTAISSPFTYLDKEDVPYLMFHGTEDVVVSPIATMELYNRCQELGIESERYSVVGMGHGGWQMETNRVYAIIDEFMDKIVADCANESK
ncbi:alpha/beta hydrolase [Adlercreutzia sp. ZJ473]|uniref:alpha/beta hydrolase n=1 Tax=Adlercreutzia sp. ZJ473 TaxID=2722822 RepID=UPI00155715B9|nr:alpha/beta hydrolase [Adlercreutzia sp. ZJ473]